LLVIIGERCDECLILHISPHNTDICVRDTLNITVTTNRSEPHISPYTIYVDGDVCSSGSTNGLVACREEEGSVVQRIIFTYHITAIKYGTTNIQAQTIYYGSEFYSPRVELTITECTPDGE